MRKLLIITLILFMLSGFAEESMYITSENRSWYHRDISCRFGEFSFGNAFDLTESSAVSSSEEALFLRPCPACAREWKAEFTGEEVEWTHEVEPWQLGGLLEMRLPYDILKTYGDLVEWMNDNYPVGPYPDGYAGLYRNASGGITLMLVHPTSERISEIRMRTASEFWVLSADYDWNTLTALENTLIGMMDDSFGIHTVYISVDANCAVVYVDDDCAEIRNAIYSRITQNGFDRAALVIEKAERASAFY